MFLNSFNYFRGLAIVVIVAGHCFDLADWTNATLPQRLIRNLMAGGSCLFVFISGFLFHHVFFEGFQFRRFVAGKAKNVLLPYLILSALPITYFVIVQKPHFDGFFLPRGEGVLSQFVVPYLKYLGTGVFFIPYWYIAFIMLMFVLSPLHVAFVRLVPELRIALTAGLLVLAVLLHRPIDNLNVLQSLAYFFPVYLLGILCSIHKNWVYRVFRGRELWLLVPMTLVWLWQTLGLGHVGNYNKAPFAWAGLDWVLIQKALMCPLLMVFLHRFENKSWPLLGLLAAASFGIYFLHAWVLAIAYALKDGRPFGVSSYLLWPLATVAVLAVSLGCAWLVRRLLGKRSRMVTGW